MKFIKPILVLFTFALALLFITACGSSKSSSSSTGSKARTIEEIKKSGELRIAVFGDKKPFGYVDNDGSYQGYDIELGNQLAKDLGVKPKYVSVDAANRAEYLISNKVDITLANFTVTDERKKQVDFALPYMKVSLGVVSPKDKVITDVKQLEGKTLIVTKGTTAETYFEKNHPEVKLQKYDQYSDAYQALLDGRGDAFSTDNTEVLAWALENKDTKLELHHLVIQILSHQRFKKETKNSSISLTMTFKSLEKKTSSTKLTRKLFTQPTAMLQKQMTSLLKVAK